MFIEVLFLQTTNQIQQKRAQVGEIPQITITQDIPVKFMPSLVYVYRLCSTLFKY